MGMNVEIWYLIGNLQIGGAERTLVDLANNLENGQFDATIWTVKDEGGFRDEVADSVTYRSLEARGKWDLEIPLVSTSLGLVLALYYTSSRFRLPSGWGEMGRQVASAAGMAAIIAATKYAAMPVTGVEVVDVTILVCIGALSYTLLLLYLSHTVREFVSDEFEVVQILV